MSNDRVCACGLPCVGVRCAWCQVAFGTRVVGHAAASGRWRRNGRSESHLSKGQSVPATAASTEEGMRSCSLHCTTCLRPLAVNYADFTLGQCWSWRLAHTQGPTAVPTADHHDPEVRDRPLNSRARSPHLAPSFHRHCQLYHSAVESRNAMCALSTLLSQEPAS